MSAETGTTTVELTYNKKWRWTVRNELCTYSGHNYTKWGAKRAIRRVLEWI